MPTNRRRKVTGVNRAMRPRHVSPGPTGHDNDAALGVPGFTALHQRTCACDCCGEGLADADHERTAVWPNGEIGRDANVVQAGHITQAGDANGLNQLFVACRRAALSDRKQIRHSAADEVRSLPAA